MKARMQYNDFIGTSAADISDHINLEQFLLSRGVDIERYTAVGASFYAGEDAFFSADIICIDQEQSNDGNDYLIKIHFENELNYAQFFTLFKRFEVIICTNHANHGDKEINETIII